jgi:ATP-dependent exoDNAse (exonuclease V) beta subunit
MVEAGAGTGKTRALVDRVVALVLNGTPLNKIAAITFTEKAATELRDRIRTGLETARASRPQSGDPIETALESLDRAQISTIHAFCQSVLRTFAARSGTDPSFVVADEVKAERRLQERWRLYLDALVFDESAAAIVHRVLALGITPGEIEMLAADLTDRSDLAALLEARPLSAAPPTWPNLDAMARNLGNLGVEDGPRDDELRLRVERVISLVGDLIAAGTGDREAVLASGASILQLKFGVSNKGIWSDRIGGLRDTAKESCRELNETLASCRNEALSRLMPIVVGFVKKEAIERRRDGELTFDDLILGTRDLLQADREAVESLRDRYDALLIDEFQDTDPLQVDIAMAFGTDPATGKMEAGRLFLVGDPKQSIYRFRRADMGMYSGVRKSVGDSGGEFPVLSQNRRSRAVILSWVNDVFMKMIGNGEMADVQPPYQPIVEERGESLAGPGVACFGGDVGKEWGAREIREMEATEAARLCRAAVDELWEVWDVSTAQSRRAKYRDVALLMPTRTILGALERALGESGVPYRVEGGSLIYRTQEVRDLVNCLAAINDPDDEVAVVAALRSPAFACSDVDLARHKANGGFFNYNRPSPEKGDERVTSSLAALADYHSTRQDLSLAALVERFVAERLIVETGVLDRGDRNTFRRMRFVAEQARVFESIGPESLREFVAWLENCAEREFLDNEGAGLDDDEDAVRILTIHGAKGLEFPIVIMVGTATSPNDRPKTYMANHGTGEVAVAIGAIGYNRHFEAGPYETLRGVEKEHSDAEFARMLYVAATRARDHLLVSLYRSASRAARSAATRLEESGARNLAPPIVAPATQGSRTPSPLSGLTVDAPPYVTVGEFRMARDELVARARRRLFTSATAEVRETRGGAEKESANDESEPWSRGRGGTRLGRAVHATIQSLPWDADVQTVTAFSNAQAVAEAIPQRASQVSRLVQNALASNAAQRARAAPRALREVPFAVQSGDVTVEGFIDLLIEDVTGLEVVDWKTDQIEESEVEGRLEDYRLQAGLYVWGIQLATGMHVHRVTYVFVSAGREISPGEPQELAESARRHLSTRTVAPPPL